MLVNVKVVLHVGKVSMLVSNKSVTATHMYVYHSYAITKKVSSAMIEIIDAIRFQ